MLGVSFGIPGAAWDVLALMEPLGAYENIEKLKFLVVF